MLIHEVTAMRWHIKKYFHFLFFLCLIIGIRLIVIGKSLAFVNKTAKKIFSILPPANNISAITNWPGKANAKKVEEKLCNIVKPEFFRKAPNVNILNPNPIAGTPKENTIPFLIGVEKKFFILISYKFN